MKEKTIKEKINERNVIINRIKKITNDKNIIGNVAYLKSRWQDEKEYEDFKDYANFMEEKLYGKIDNFISLTKRPFGFVVEINKIKIHFFLKSRGDSCWLCAKTFKGGK